MLRATICQFWHASPAQLQSGDVAALLQLDELQGGTPGCQLARTLLGSFTWVLNARSPATAMQDFCVIEVVPQFAAVPGGFREE